mmetsp:Transcript_94325/g.173645  ORF Transcript_94325/g.173645 Transcript_94325/m.173645 type:complete len:398 (-) Transcript_94325:122-1315(-)
MDAYSLMFAAIALRVIAEDMVANWKASLETPKSPEMYRLVMQWDHIAAEAVTITWKPWQGARKPTDDPRCSGKSNKKAPDGQPYWMPRFFPRSVSSEIKAQTGIQFASVDWQPCGHKDILICHGESHYDFHLYYDTEERMNSLAMCKIGTKANPSLPVCENTSDLINKDYFKLIGKNMPRSAKVTSGTDSRLTVDKTFDFCVDPTSAILRSGVHYGDETETLTEWKAPVTIIGSHNCSLKFFEPMISSKWITGQSPNSPWPHYEVSDIQYNQKDFVALPSGWSISVTEGCKDSSSGSCHITVTVEGTRCPESGCIVKQECGTMKRCSTAKQEKSPSSATTDKSPPTKMDKSPGGLDPVVTPASDSALMACTIDALRTSRTTLLLHAFIMVTTAPNYS